MKIVCLLQEVVLDQYVYRWSLRVRNERIFRHAPREGYLHPLPWNSSPSGCRVRIHVVVSKYVKCSALRVDSVISKRIRSFEIQLMRITQFTIQERGDGRPC